MDVSTQKRWRHVTILSKNQHVEGGIKTQMEGLEQSTEDANVMFIFK